MSLIAGLLVLTTVWHRLIHHGAGTSGVRVWGFALLWLALVVALTVRARPAFATSWWAFTFPLGTVVTGTSGLAAATGSTAVAVVAVVLYVGLVAAWVTVVTATARRAPRTWPALAAAR